MLRVRLDSIMPRLFRDNTDASCTGRINTHVFYSFVFHLCAVPVRCVPIADKERAKQQHCDRDAEETRSYAESPGDGATATRTHVLYCRDHPRATEIWMLSTFIVYS